MFHTKTLSQQSTGSLGIKHVAKFWLRSVPMPDTASMAEAKTESAEEKGFDEKSKTSRDLIYDCFRRVWISESVSKFTCPNHSIQPTQNHCLPTRRVLYITLAKVTADQNIGEWLNEKYADRDKFQKVLNRAVYERASDDADDRTSMAVKLAPTSTVKEMFIRLDQLDYSADAKHGCYLAIFLCVVPYFDHDNWFSLSALICLALTKSSRTMPTSSSTLNRSCTQTWMPSGNLWRWGSARAQVIGQLGRSRWSTSMALPRGSFATQLQQSLTTWNLALKKK